MSTKYEFTIYMNTPQETVKIDIPNHLQNKTNKFIVNSVIVKMTTGPSAVFIHSDALRNQEVIYTYNGSNSLIATTVGSDIVSNPINEYLDIGHFGFDWPNSLNYGGDIDLTLRDEIGNLLTDIDFAAITITVAETK